MSEKVVPAYTTFWQTHAKGQQKALLIPRHDFYFAQLMCDVDILPYIIFLRLKIFKIYLIDGQNANLWITAINCVRNSGRPGQSAN